MKNIGREIMKRMLKLTCVFAVAILPVAAWMSIQLVKAENSVPVGEYSAHAAKFSSFRPSLLAPLPLVVNSTGDAVDAIPGDNLCQTATPGECTLRAAIQEANAVNDADTINFLIPGAGVQTISPASALPVISQPVTIDGYTQPTSTQNTLAVGDNAVINIELNGTGAGAGVDGLAITAGSCTVRGLAIYRFGGDGIQLSTAGGNTITGNFIGTNATGAGTTNGNTADGVNISNVGTNTIGGSTPQARNIISDNDVGGVNISGASATGNMVQGNYIGTDRNGTADVGNGVDGVFLAGPTNTIGGSTATPGQGAGNVISGNGPGSLTGSGIRITTTGNTNTVAGNLIGLAAGGAAALGNSNNGVFITNTAATNTIGGTTADLRNVISSNTGAGVSINGAGTTGNIVRANYIGTDAAGTVDRGNTTDGVLINGGAATNAIGGLTATPGTAPGNVISGNDSHGIEIANAASSSNTVQGNLVGLQAGGTALLRNGSNGVFINGAASNTIGGSTSTARNVITGGTAATSDGVDIQLDASDNNVVAGNYIGTDITGTLDFGAGGDGVRLSGTGGPDNNTIGGSATTPGTAPGNVISGNNGDGIEIANSGATGNLLQGNLIGTQANGTTALANGVDGVLLNDAGVTTIGGSTATPGTGVGNVISGNIDDGITITSTNGSTVQGNIIGLQAGGAAALGNGEDGIELTSGINNLFGGATANFRNIISGNTFSGIRLAEGQGSGTADNNNIQSNYIGTDITGAVDLGNTGNGIILSAADSLTIGGTTATPGTAPGNIISGNNGDGVELGADASSVSVVGNLIGLKSNGTEALPNSVNGVLINCADTNTVGGAAANQRNIISGNGDDGVEISCNNTGNSSGNNVRGNFIGTDTGGTAAIANAQSGVHCGTFTANNTVGGAAAGEGNTIAFNGGDGVFVSAGLTSRISRNSIHSNTGLGIDLGTNGVTPNDTDDPDSGANTLQNFPIITSVQQGSTIVMGTLNSTPSTTFTIEFFSNVTPDPSGNGEGQTYLDSTTVTTDAGGDVAFSHTIAATVPLNEKITATATDPAGNTSEFSNSQIVLSPTLVKLRSFTATNDNGEVMLRWESGYEVDNLGYYLYREQNGQRTSVTPSMIAGSALLAAERTVLTAGNSYTWFDRMPAEGGSVAYWLEDVDTNGTRTLHGPVSPEQGKVDRQRSAPAQAALLNQLSADTANAQQEWATVWDKQRMQLNRGPVKNSALLARQQSLVGKPGVKIMVRQPGWVRVHQPELTAAGLGGNVNASLLQLYADGREVPIIVSDINHQGQFTANDWIEFYGHGLDLPTTDTRAYYLTVGTSAGKRIPRIRAVQTGSSNTPAAGFSQTVERKDRSIFFTGLNNGEAENFFGQIISTTPVQTTLMAQRWDTATTGGQLHVTLQGVTSGLHQVRVQLNNAHLGTMGFTGRERKTESFTINVSQLRQGKNMVRMVAAGGATDISLVDAVRLVFSRTYVAANNRLQFSVNNDAPVSILGFDTPNIRIVDITNPHAVQELTPVVKPRGPLYMATLRVTGARAQNVRTLLAFVDNEVDSPAGVTGNEPSSLADSNNRADFLIITERSLRDTVQPLADLRRNQGLEVSVVDVEDIYDEFSYGAHSPQAIRDFLTRAAQSWQHAPQYVLLAGDATYDPRNYLGQGNNDLVPTKMFYAGMMETSSDDWLADFNDDGVPELAVGRLPVRTIVEAERIISRIVGFSPGSAGLGVLLIADRNDADNNFEAASQNVQSLLPVGTQVQVINRGNQDTNTVRSQIIGGINQGPLVVNYYGHGSIGLWTGAGLLNTSDASALTNGTRLPLFTMMTCLNGFFHDVNGESMSEALLKAEQGGAIAVWASSGLTEMSGQALMGEQMYGAIFGQQSLALGDAVRTAKAATQDQGVRRTWIFFGDPTMRLR